MILLGPPSLTNLSLYIAGRLISPVTGLSRRNAYAQEFNYSSEQKGVKILYQGFLINLLPNNLYINASLFAELLVDFREAQIESCLPSSLEGERSNLPTQTVRGETQDFGVGFEICSWMENSPWPPRAHNLVEGDRIQQIIIV